MLVGPHGVGKSMIVKTSAKGLGGKCFTVEASALNEGEITGLPFAAKNADNSTEVRFVKYFQINKIWQLEKYYFEKAMSTGFLNGTVKIEQDEEGNLYTIVKGKKELYKTALDFITDGEDNKYKWAEKLPTDVKLELIDSGEVQPVYIFIDELNRSEQQTMREMMNIILERTVNGYVFPFFVQLVAAQNPCSQNSTYATNELDDAQLDRFLKISVDANIEEWIDYALLKGLNKDVIEALALSDGIFVHREQGQKDMSEMTPSPRSWEMVCNILDIVRTMNESRFFSPEERKAVEEDLRILIRGKVGETAARTLLETINRKDNNIKPTEILTGKELKVPEAVMKKFASQKRLTQKIISDSLAKYICDNCDLFDKSKVGSDEKKKATFMNYQSQLKDFLFSLDQATQILFIRKILSAPNGNQVYKCVAPCFSVELLKALVDNKLTLGEALK
jgi:MoxR-like ATPase